MSSIHTLGLTKSYGHHRGILDVSLDVQDGEVFGFLGPNGAGKTTTIRILMGLLRLDSGTALIRGLDAWTKSVEIKPYVGYLPSDFSLDPNLTGREIIQYLANLRGGVDRSYVSALAERLNLDLSRKFRQYSHGNKQKVGIVQAFMHRPSVLILDEPTSGLDPLMQQESALLVEEARAEGRTVFLSSHDLSEVERLCSRVGIIRDGRIVTIGTLDTLRDMKRHKLDITFAAHVLPQVFANVPGVEQVTTTAEGEPTTLRILVQGDLDPALKVAAQHPIRNLVSHEPSLEEIFLHHYQNMVSERSATAPVPGAQKTSR